MKLRRIAGLFGAVVMVLSAPVHILTYWNINLAEEYTLVWALFAFGVAIFMFAIITLYLKIGNRPPLHVTYQATLARMPKWTWFTLAIYFSYMLFSAAVFGLGLAVPEEYNGHYIVNNHGQITEYTFEETQKAKLYRLRSYSEFWIWLTLCSTLYFLTAREDTSDKS